MSSVTRQGAILITGGSGFVGRTVIAELCSRGILCEAVSRTYDPAFRPYVKQHLLDIHDHLAVTELMKTVRPTQLLHLAWFAAPGSFWESSQNLNWVGSTLNLVREAMASGCSRIVVTGSCAEYDWTQGWCDEQSGVKRPATLYGVCKEAVRDILEHYCRRHGASFAWCRLFWLYGPHEKPGRLVSDTINAMLDGTVATCSHGMQQRDFMHVSDVASALATILQTDADGEFNVSSGEAITVRALVENIARQLGGEVSFSGVRPAVDEAPLVAGMPTQLRQLGWRPRYSAESGIAATCDWWRQNRALPL